MPIAFVPFEPQHEDAVRRFNERLVAGHAVTPFFPEAKAPQGTNANMQPFLAVDHDAGQLEVRGSFLEVRYPALIAGAEGEVLNCQSPVSEGLVDQKYLLLPSQIFKVLLRKNPFVFVVGMGGLQNPLPRFLKAAGWSVEEVPFYYKVIRASRFLQQMPQLQQPVWKKTAAQIGAFSGLGALAFRVMHRNKSVPDLRRYSIAKAEWGPWATELWERFRMQIQFGVARDQASVPLLYRSGREIGPLVIQHDGVICGWSMALLTPMQNNVHFANLRVATILDCIADDEHRVAAVTRTVEYLAQAGADIVITNQSHAPTQQAFLDAGFRPGPSNYLLAASPKLAAAIGGTPVKSGSIHLTRSDGDGPINL